MKYIAYAKSISYVKLEIEADSIEEARDIAEWSDGGEWVEYSGGWEYETIEEVAEPLNDKVE